MLKLSRDQAIFEDRVPFRLCLFWVARATYLPFKAHIADRVCFSLLNGSLKCLTNEISLITLQFDVQLRIIWGINLNHHQYVHKNCCCLFCFFETKLLLSFEVWCLFPEQQPPFPFCKTLVFIWVGQNWYAFKYKFNQPEIERHCTLLNYWTHCVYIIKWTTQSFPILKSIYIISTAFRSYIDWLLVCMCTFSNIMFVSACRCTDQNHDNSLYHVT